MAIGGISQTGIESNLINQKMSALNQETQSKPDKGKDDSIIGTDTVILTANVSERSAIEFEFLDEEQANILAQLVANDLRMQSFGMSTQTGIEALRPYI